MIKRRSRSSIVVFILGGLFMFLEACSGLPERQVPLVPAKRPVSEFVKDDVQYTIDAYDPWEGFNRRIYMFNAQFDQYVFLPIVSAYEFILPDFVEARVSNFFDNLAEVRNLTNALLQFKGVKFFITAYRMIINTTVGVLGFFDPATALEIPRQNEDFGQTLGMYGLGAGPYLMLPLLGPSTVRDTVGLTADSLIYNFMLQEIIHEFDMRDSREDLLRTGLLVLNSVDARHRQSFRYYQTGSPFEYELVRLFYLRKRLLQIDN